MLYSVALNRAVIPTEDFNYYETSRKLVSDINHKYNMEYEKKYEWKINEQHTRNDKSPNSTPRFLRGSRTTYVTQRYVIASNSRTSNQLREFRTRSIETTFASHSFRSMVSSSLSRLRRWYLRRVTARREMRREARRQCYSFNNNIMLLCTFVP